MKQPHLLRDEKSLRYAVDQLRILDNDTIENMMQHCGPPPLRLREPGLAGMIRIIISQQVSTASADAIHARFMDRYQKPVAADLLAASDDDLRECGLSLPKMRAIRNFSSALDCGSLDLDILPSMTPEAARETLTQVKGIGPWSADVYLLFCLGHPDVWPAGDLALQEGVRMALNLCKRPDAVRLEKLSKRWRPWRAAAARLIWAYYGSARKQSESAKQPPVQSPKRKPKTARK